MLRDSLYRIIASTHQDGLIQATLKIDQNHEIFKGHFPGQPVLPGACVLQMVKEVLADQLKKDFRLKKANSIKFIQIVDPQINNVIILKLTCKLLDDNTLQVNGTLSCSETVCFKLQSVFI